MPNTLQIKRGLQVNLPTGIAGELLFTTDTKRVYIGDGATNNLLQGASSILTTGMVSFSDSSGKLTGSSSLYWDNTNGRLGIGTSSPTQALNVSGFSVLATSKTTATPILAVTNTTSSSPNSNNFDCFAPNMPNASVLGVFYGGKNLSSRNNFGFNWNHVSDGSTGNSVSFEMVSVANIIRAWATGNVGLNTTTDAGFKLDVNGTARVSGELTVNGVSIGLGGGANTLNTILGATALSSNTTGTGNTAIGNQAIKDNISGINNTAVGLNALRFTKGSGNTGIGAAAGFNLISNSDNTFVGYNSGLNTTGSRNTLIGNGAGDGLTTGVENTAIGYRAGRGTTSTASYNTSLGVQANISITSGQFNLSAGNNALYFNTTGSNNIALGSYSGQYITGGVTNNTISNNSIYIGNNTKAFADNQTNQIVIGYDATGAGSNTATFGNTSIVDTILRGRVNLQQYATGSRPTYVKGALIYDSTLSKLVVGGASGWEVVTSI
jgi:hypothetical protein